LYNYPEGVEKPVFGIDRVQSGEPVIICESAINALTARVYGYQAVALLGTGNSYQAQQLKELGVNDYVLCFDGDEAGHKATEKWRKILRKTSFVWAIKMPDGKDLNDCTKEEFDALYAERE
jgi:DNA primase